MSIRDKRDAHLRRRFKNIKKMEGIILGKQIREERRMLKRAMSKRSRKHDRLAIKESMEVMD